MPSAPSGGNKSEEIEDSHDYLKLVHEEKPRSEMITVDDPGSNPDTQEATSYKDPLASLAEVLRSGSLGRRVSNNKQRICYECKQPIEKGNNF